MAEFDERLDRAQQRLRDSIPPDTTVECGACGRIDEVLLAECLNTGWPTCCGRVMRPLAYLTVHDVARLARCHHNTVRLAIAAGRLEAFEPAHKLLVREVDARAWIESRPASTSSPARPRRGGGGGRRPRPRAGSVASLRDLEREGGS